MGDRFYQQQLDKLGTCPGMKTKTRNRRMAWDDDKKAQAVEMYEAENPTSENSMEIVKEIADELNESPNGVRMILSKAGVYIKKAPAAAASGGAKAPSTRVSKQDAQDALVLAIQSADKEVDMDIVSKLTGKAAQYFTTLITD